MRRSSATLPGAAAKAAVLGTVLMALTVFVLIRPGLAAPLPPFGSDPVEDTSSPSGSPIADVRVGANDGFDRFVVEFEGDIGAYFVSYTDVIAQDGSGTEVPVEGSSFIQVSLNGVPNEPLAPQETIDAGLTGLVQVVGAGAGFEATVSYGLGTAATSGFRVFTLSGPSRLVVDVAHPDATPTASNTADPTESPTPTTESSAPGTTEVDNAAAEDGGSSPGWLLWLAGGLVVVAIGVAALAWRNRRTS